MIEEVGIATHKLYHPQASRVKVSYKQISGHLSNDNKQVNIPTGQCSYSVGYPLACCMVSVDTSLNSVDH